MSASIPSPVRALAASLIALWLGLPAHAEETAAAPAASTEVAPGDGLRVSIDPVTKRIRPLTASQQDALGAASAKAPRGERLREAITSRATGARGIVASPEDMSYTRAAVGANGKLVSDCVDGEEAAAEHQHDHPVGLAVKGALR